VVAELVPDTADGQARAGPGDTRRFERELRVSVVTISAVSE